MHAQAELPGNAPVRRNQQPYPAWLDRPYAPAPYPVTPYPQAPYPRESINPPAAVPNTRPISYVPNQDTGPPVAPPPWRFMVSPPPTEPEVSPTTREDLESRTNLRQVRTHRSTRSTGDLNREVRLGEGGIPTQAFTPGRAGPAGPAGPNDAGNGSLLNTRLQAALRLQEDGFAAIAQRNSSEDMRRTQSNRESQPYPRLRRIRDAREAEQIKRDEELAKQISVADLGAAFRGTGRYQSPAAGARNSNETADSVEPDDPVIFALDDNSSVYHDRNSGSTALPGTYDPDSPPPLPERPAHIPGYRPNEPLIDEITSVPRGPAYDHQTTDTETPDVNVSRSSSYFHDEWEVPAQVPGRIPVLPSQPAVSTYTTATTALGSDRPPPVPQKSDDEDSLEPWSINTSRTNFINAGPRENYAVCEPCGREQPAVAYCSNCGAQFCSYHWAEQWVHRDKSDQRLKDGVPHEKTDPWLANKIKTIIEPSLSQEEQNRLHQQDEDTTWFGVMPDNAGKLMFHDFGRYEQSSLESRFPQKSSQYPSLISFVGTTGAGKSTLIKGLVKLASSKRGEKSQTPIVGLVQNQHVPTSGEVHLYWDPCSFNSNRPLLYADCEGLGGGSREPMAARATAIKEKRENHKRRPQSDAWQSSVPHTDNNTRRGSNFKASPFSSMSPSNTPMPPASPGLQVLSEFITPTPMPSYSPHSPTTETGWKSVSNKTYRGTTREITWACDKEKRSRQFVVENLYPRLLYTFSDIVVLVMRNAKEIETAVERLIRWAHTALEKSSNQPMLPFGIIVMNAVDNRTDPALWDVNTATNFLLRSIADAVNKNPIFERWAWDWRAKDKRITTTEDLLRVYYSSVRIVYIPHKARPNLVWRQYSRLYEEINASVAGSEIQRRNARLLLSSDQFHPYLQFAFDHFSKTLEDPFDFVKASSAFSQGQQNINPIFSLIKDYRLAKPDNDIMTLFKDVAPLVASAVMVDVTRKQVKGNSQAVFPAYREKFGQALKAFFDGQWPCEARHPKTGERCVNVKTRHTKGHQTANGRIFADKLWATSPYQFHECGDLGSLFDQFVLEYLSTLFKTLGLKVSRKGLSGNSAECRIAFEIHQEEIIQKKCSFLHGSDALISNTVCYCCLFRFPIHSMLCGHAVCDACVNSHGRKARENVLAVESCPICGVSRTNGRSQVEIIQKPDKAGVRVLTLDGGGIRAMIQLQVLKILEDCIGLDIPIQEFFDLIVGTSGGGIVGLAIGEKNMRLPDATKMFRDFSKRAFQARRGANIPLLGTLIRVRHHSRYETNGLEDALKETFGSELLFGGSRQVQSPSRCKVAVTTTDTNEHAKLLANYNRATRLQTPYEFQRFEKSGQDLRVWEAARATSAAPGFFKAFYCGQNGHTYEDGALKLNNPVLAADYERQVIWPERCHLFPDILVSIGTGYFPDVKTRSSDPGPSIGIGLVNGVKTFVKIARSSVENQLDCERTWDEYIQCTLSEHSEMKTRFHRLSLRINGPKIDLDAVDELDKLEYLTKQEYNRAGPINEVAGQLIASLFYFEEVTRVAGRIVGMIKCRLPQETSPHGSLQKLARGLRHMDSRSRCFRIYPNTASNRWIPAAIDDLMLSHVERRMQEFAVQVTFDINEQCASTIIYLCLPSFRGQAISGFPMSLLEATSAMSSPVLSRENTTS